MEEGMTREGVESSIFHILRCMHEERSTVTDNLLNTDAALRAAIKQMEKERDALANNVKDREDEIFRLRDLEGVPQCWKAEHITLEQPLAQANTRIAKLEHEIQTFTDPLGH